MQSVDERLEKLEKSNRRWKILACVMSVSLVAITTLAADKPTTTKASEGTGKRAPTIADVVYARKFVVVNDRGEPLAELGQSKDVGLIGIVSRDGRFRFVATADDDGCGYVSTFNGKNQRLVAVGATDQGEGRVTVFNDKGQTIIDVAGTPQNVEGTN